MTPETTTDEVVFTLRIPATLNEKLIAEAEQEKRSRQSHIVYLLEKTFEKSNGKKEAKK